MKKTLYLDCFSGISGDMTLAALLDAGADLDYIVAELRKLPIDPFEIHVHTVVKKGISAKHLHIHLDEPEGHHHDHDHSHDHGHTHEHEHSHSHSHAHTHEHEHSHSHSHTHSHEHDHSHSHHNHGHTHEHDHSHSHSHDHSHEHDHSHDHVHRKAADILAMIEDSELPARVKQRSTAIFREIAIAEGKIHGMPPEDVHFHEVGAMDSIIDIIGVCLAMESLDIDTIQASPVPTGHGRLYIAHGLYPIPAPATMELLRGIPLSSLQAEGELTTPTGAGIVKALAAGFGPIPAMTIRSIGYGAGKKEFAHPNVLRACVLTDEVSGQHHHGSDDAYETVVVLEAQVDDSTGELLGYVMEQLSQAALDVFFTPVYMKKNRAGTLLTVLSLEERADQCEEMMLRETSTLGVRRANWKRRALGRSWEEVTTRYGIIRVKHALMNGQVVHSSPEYEDAAQAAKKYQVPLHEVYTEALAGIKK